MCGLIFFIFKFFWNYHYSAYLYIHLHFKQTGASYKGDNKNDHDNNGSSFSNNSEEEDKFYDDDDNIPLVRYISFTILQINRICFVDLYIMILSQYIRLYLSLIPETILRDSRRVEGQNLYFNGWQQCFKCFSNLLKERFSLNK